MKPFRIHTLALLALITGLLYSGCKSEHKVALSFNPQKGKKYEFTQEVIQDIDMGNSGHLSSLKNTSVFIYNVEVTEKDGKNFILNMLIKRIKFDMSAAGAENTITYDSDKPDSVNEPATEFLSKIYSKIIGQPIAVTVNEKGEVVALSGVQQILNKLIVDTLLNSMPNAEQAKNYLKTNFSEDFYKRSFSEMFNVLPGKEVSVGDAWEKQHGKTLMEMNVDSKIENELKGIATNTAVINTNGDINLASSGSQNSTVVKMTGTHTGSMKVDIATGLIAESTVNHTANGSYNVQGQDMPFKIHSTTKITSKEIK
ncbi:MAG TPA: DUF6263 family protein [Bacteroidia bacterium]|nr:DUF6263 family protein [Bacteroidia bacterium]